MEGPPRDLESALANALPAKPVGREDALRATALALEGHRTIPSADVDDAQTVEARRQVQLRRLERGVVDPRRYETAAEADAMKPPDRGHRLPEPACIFRAHPPSCDEPPRARAGALRPHGPMKTSEPPH